MGGFQDPKAALRDKTEERGRENEKDAFIVLHQRS